MKYALLTVSQYIALNEAISTAKGYTIETDTARYEELIPKLAKVATTEEDYQLLCVMTISAEVQENYPELLKGIELVDNYTAADTTLNRIELSELSHSTADWFQAHVCTVSTNVEICGCDETEAH